MTEPGRAQRRRGARLALETKVLVSMLGLLALLVAAVVVAVVLIVRINDDAIAFTDREIQYATAIDVAALHAKGIANDERGFLLSGRREFIREIDARTGNALAAFSVAATAAEDRAQRQAVNQAHEGFEHWVQALRLEIATYQAGKREQAIAASLGPTRALRKSYEQSFARARALGVNAIESGRSSVTAASSRSVRILLGYLAFALAFGILVTLWVVRAVRPPVREAVQPALADEEEGDRRPVLRRLDDRAYAVSRRWGVDRPADETPDDDVGDSSS